MADYDMERLWMDWEELYTHINCHAPYFGPVLSQQVWDMFCGYAYAYGANQESLVLYRNNRWHLDNRFGVETKRMEEL